MDLNINCTDLLMNTNGISTQNTGNLLNDQWNVGAAHALYSREGNWYHHLKHFPGAYFDANGYILFETEEEFLMNPNLGKGKRVNINNGISSLGGYIRVHNESVIDDEIVDDDDTMESDRYNNGESIYPYEMPEEVDVQNLPQTVYEWMRKLDRGTIVTNPEFQRNLVWKPEQKSLFIESVLLNIPLPPLYVNQRQDGKFILIDGLQRTTALHEFINDKFRLSKLRVLTEWNDKFFSKLDIKLQTKIEDKSLLVYVMKPSVPIQMVYDIFHRINTGGTQLTRQEIRNCFYIGQATDTLKELAESEEFRLAIDNGISPKRMKDREAVLRYLAFRILDYQTEYKNDMDDFLGKAMERINIMQADQLQPYKDEFRRVMQLSYQFFGEKNFRLPTESTRGRINIALMESVSYYFANQTSDLAQKNKKRIVKNYESLLEDADFLDAIRFSTGDTRRVRTRFLRASEILGAE